MENKRVSSFMHDGLIRIGTLYDFRNLEKHGSDIGDTGEGTKTLSTDGYHFLDTDALESISCWYKDHFENTFNLAFRGYSRLRACFTEGSVVITKCQTQHYSML
jgi:hypothetical protein